MNRLSIIVILLSFIVASCTNYSEIEIKEVKISKIELQSTSNAIVEMQLAIDNPVNARIYLNSFDGFVTKNGANFAQIRLLSSDTLAAKAVSTQSLTFQVELLDPLALLSMGLNISTWNIKDFNIDGRVTIKTTSGFRHQVKIKDVPLEKLIKKF